MTASWMGSGTAREVEMPNITSLKDDDSLIVSEAPIQLPIPHVHGIDPTGPVLEETIRKPTCRSTDVQDDTIRHVEGKGVQRCRKFVSSPAHKRACRPFHLNGRLPCNECRPLFHARPIDFDQSRQDQPLRLLPAAGQLTSD